MKTRIGVLVGAGVCALALSASAISIGSNITIYDGNIGTHGGGTGRGLEDEETDYNSTYDQKWDLEGFFWSASSKTLTGVGGFDFVNGDEGQLAGDIFVDVDGDAQIPATGLPGDLHGYDYVINMGWNDSAADLAYEVLDIRGGALLDTAWSTRPGANPYRYRSGGLSVISGVAQYVTGLNDDLDGDGIVDVTGGNGLHNAYQLDLSWLSDYSGITFHQTMTCGNDGMNGHIPDGGVTIALLGIALVGMGSLKRSLR